MPKCLVALEVQRARWGLQNAANTRTSLSATETHVLADYVKELESAAGDVLALTGRTHISDGVWDRLARVLGFGKI